MNTNTPMGSVVIAGEFASGMIPAFTDSRVLIARDDVVPDYYQVRDGLFAVLDGRAPDYIAKDFLRRYNVRYILFGLDSHRFEDTENTKFPFLKEVFRSGNVSVVAVRIN